MPSKKIAFQGEPGAYSEEALFLLAPDAESQPHREFRDVAQQRSEDEPHNQTRFLLVAREATAPPPDVAAKTTLRLKLPHRPGTLARALAPFAEAGLNLTKLESRPDRSTPWEYLFYLDVEARADEPAMRAARAALAAQGAGIPPLREQARLAPRRSSA